MAIAPHKLGCCSQGRARCSSGSVEQTSEEVLTKGSRPLPSQLAANIGTHELVLLHHAQVYALPSMDATWQALHDELNELHGRLGAVVKADWKPLPPASM